MLSQKSKGLDTIMNSTIRHRNYMLRQLDRGYVKKQFTFSQIKAMEAAKPSETPAEAMASV